MTLKELQDEQAIWSAANFKATDYGSLLGIGEEFGELAHAHLKGLQGIRYTPEEVFAKKEDALADMLIFMVDYATQNKIDLQCAIDKTWPKVQQRNWKQNPMDANKLVAGSL